MLGGRGHPTRARTCTCTKIAQEARGVAAAGLKIILIKTLETQSIDISPVPILVAACSRQQLEQQRKITVCTNSLAELLTI